MNESFASVLLFHTALKNFLMTTLGLTVDRALSANDTILTNGSGMFLRLQKKTQGSMTCVGIEVGGSADALELSTKDPECCFPFDTTSEGVFAVNAVWTAEASCLNLTIFGSGERWSKRYRANLTVAPVSFSVVHQDHLDLLTEPNFKERSGTYISAGA